MEGIGEPVHDSASKLMVANMDEPVESPLDEKRQKLLELSLGDLLAWQPPRIEKTVGPFDPTAFDDWNVRRLEAIRLCQEKLLEYSEEEIAILLGEKQADGDALGLEWRTFYRNVALRVREDQPQWHAGGFGHPEHVADFARYASLPSLSAEELVLLSVGVEPHHFPEDALRLLARRNRTQLSPTQEFLVLRYDQIQRQFPIPQISLDWFFEWAEKTEFEMHREFLRRLRKFHGQKVEPVVAGGSESETELADWKEVESVAKLITALAMDYYGYRPEQDRSPTPTELTDLAAEHGIAISVDTVRKYLKLGAKTIAGTRTKPNSLPRKPNRK